MHQINRQSAPFCGHRLDADGNDVDVRLARLEYLMDRRPVLLSSVLLRQNPHNVHEWHKRAKLFTEDPAQARV